jgi:hypothetical protein
MLGPIVTIGMQDGYIVLVSIVPMRMISIGNIDLFQRMGMCGTDSVQDVLDDIAQGTAVFGKQSNARSMGMIRGVNGPCDTTTTAAGTA